MRTIQNLGNMDTKQADTCATVLQVLRNPQSIIGTGLYPSDALCLFLFFYQTWLSLLVDLIKTQKTHF